MSKWIDNSKYRDFVYIDEKQKFPSSKIHDERFDKLKERQNEYKRKMMFKQEFQMDQYSGVDLPMDPRSVADRPVKGSKLGGFINVPPKIPQQPVHFNSPITKKDTSSIDKDIDNIMHYIDEFDKFDVKADNARDMINEKINDVSDVQCKYTGLGIFGQHFKSAGYPSTFDHNFDYISNDMQLPDHSCTERGFPSRSLNKSNNKTRAIMQ